MNATLDATVVLGDMLRIAGERCSVDLDPLLQARIVHEMSDLLDLAGVELVRNG